MKPLNKKWILKYKEQDNCVTSALRGYDWRKTWIGAWRLMRDFQNSEVVIQ